MDLAHKKKIRTPGISDLLGGALSLGISIKNYYDLILLSRTGISKASAESVISFTGMSKKRFVEDILNLSIKTLERKQADDKLDKRTSSLVIEVARVLEHTYQVFDDKEKVQRWLSKPNNALHGETPLSLFSTPTGIGMVEDVLTRIEEGVYS
ncbi:type II RES/Xre toxin-antitoxin system antitoxin [Pedobacter antarcticus]|uniref:Putative toxin-antitoxin system antitoxin component, TIGR02293 family n=1 Tax=Pedobacter antarcticus TaxID=34086 RepID=A0A1I2ERV3_9SPHI|nr:antitoxin Xre/MbcA/ParS toxin-binding domain-containing protein [Pedobacter antarcticus]SDM36518.1 putative toxin-antitoxin system antitoxin component, TIGR02293 family [Pedobacter antarcticus]SFE95168.1 putative toxin-antitoxin system antitoxin component, TIGR02293 family [Pedobacter antarcticus]